MIRSSSSFSLNLLQRQLQGQGEAPGVLLSVEAFHLAPGEEDCRNLRVHNPPLLVHAREGGEDALVGEPLVVAFKLQINSININMHPFRYKILIGSP